MGGLAINVRTEVLQCSKGNSGGHPKKPWKVRFGYPDADWHRTAEQARGGARGQWGGMYGILHGASGV